ncbi:MAG: hypothetical protein Q9198_006153 [Flavoplaca austrocitrina]
MSEPIQFVASIIAVATLADNVVTKGYKYLNTVKDCPKDVRRLMAEVNVLCGVLDRLGKLLQSAEIGMPTESDDDQDAQSNLEPTSEAVATPAAQLGIPEFVYECQKTLGQVQEALAKFSSSNKDPSGIDDEKSRFNVSRLRTLQAKDFKWPLSKSKTLELIGTLERHKATCTLALASTGRADVHSVLEQTRISNKYLAEIRSKQETILKIQLSHEQKNALAWFSRVDPASKHRAFARERQDGTGMWLFDLPQMIRWLEGRKTALWVYGIPGAGKTTLSTLVVDEVLNRKRSNSIGTAYFYVRHNNQETHRVSNILGSLICQLSCQNPDALAEFMDLHAQHHGPHTAWSSSVPPPTDEELEERLQSISSHFSETYIMIDGLDECGPKFDANRTLLIDVLASLNDAREGSIRVLVFSRDEYDIRQKFAVARFDTVSVAASSADLRLFANAWLGKLEIQNDDLRMDIVDTLVDKAKGMFMWVRAQVDYLQRLPNDVEKRRALGKLPPDLPQTYVRIFETIDSSYPGQTLKYIQRLLIWILFSTSHSIGDPYGLALPIEALREIICVEDGCVWPTQEVIPTKDQIFRWLGCLVRMNQDTGQLLFSHFSVEEFLRMDAGTLSNSVAQKYLVCPEDGIYLVNTCLIYVCRIERHSVPCETLEDVDAFLANRPLYRHIAGRLIDYIKHCPAADMKCDTYLRTFLAMPPSHQFELCIKSIWRLRNEECPTTLISEIFSPLHFASALALLGQAARLLKNGASVSGFKGSRNPSLTPLHAAIAGGGRPVDIYLEEGTLVLDLEDKLERETLCGSPQGARSMLFGIVHEQRPI